jgi:hypothetical protein
MLCDLMGALHGGEGTNSSCSRGNRPRMAGGKDARPKVHSRERSKGHGEKPLRRTGFRASIGDRGRPQAEAGGKIGGLCEKRWRLAIVVDLGPVFVPPA